MSERKSLDGVFGSLKKTQPAVASTPSVAEKPISTEATAAPATKRPASVAPAPAARKASGAPKAAEKRAGVSETADAPTRPVVAYMAAEMKRKLKIKRFALDATNDEVLVAAFSEISSEELTEHFTADVIDGPSNGMPVKRRRGARTEGGGEQQHFFLSPEQIDWLDSLKELVGAPSRSALIVTALERYFSRTLNT